MECLSTFTTHFWSTEYRTSNQRKSFQSIFVIANAQHNNRPNAWQMLYSFRWTLSVFFSPLFSLSLSLRLLCVSFVGVVLVFIADGRYSPIVCISQCRCQICVDVVYQWNCADVSSWHFVFLLWSFCDKFPYNMITITTNDTDIWLVWLNSMTEHVIIGGHWT